ncbi:MAG TPA: Clp protease ClpP, partial [Flavobacteriales bacterium]|nr:Clp protease ClpP [Flavobacteriales bacterium]
MLINIFGEIGIDVIASELIERIQNNTDEKIDVIIASGGGSAFEGLMIFDALKASGKEVNTKVMGIAASSASVIFMAGDNREMGDGSLLMVHNSWSFFMGNSEEIKEKLGTLDAIDNRMMNIFKSGTGLEEEQI